LTIERWYYRVPVGVLRRKLRADAGQQPAMSGAVRQAIPAQYAAHKSWSVQWHYDNLTALAESPPSSRMSREFLLVMREAFRQRFD
jgi:hypothetical protein